MNSYYFLWCKKLKIRRNINSINLYKIKLRRKPMIYLTLINCGIMLVLILLNKILKYVYII